MSVIVITGGSRGIGASTAELCGRQGHGVILTYNRNPEAARAVVQRIESAGGKAAALQLDVSATGTFAAFRDAVVQTLRTTWGANTLGGLVNNAGYGLFNPLESVTEAQFDGLFNVHLKGPFFLTQTLLPLLEEHAHRQPHQRHHPRRYRRCGAICRLQGRPRRTHPLHGQGIR